MKRQYVLASGMTVLAVVGSVGLGACSSSDDVDWDCGTTFTRLSADPVMCEQNVPGYRWYGAHYGSYGYGTYYPYGSPLGSSYYDTDYRRYGAPHRSTRTVTVTPTASSSQKASTSAKATTRATPKTASKSR